MVLIAGCLGLRASEIVGLQWNDLDFENSTLLVQRGVVHGRVGDVKTEYSRDVVPIAPEVAAELLKYRESCYPTEEGWLFPNPATNRPYHQEEIQKSTFGWQRKRRVFNSWWGGRRFGTATVHGWTKPRRLGVGDFWTGTMGIFAPALTEFLSPHALSPHRLPIAVRGLGD